MDVAKVNQYVAKIDQDVAYVAMTKYHVASLYFKCF
jgi:hypothetical protein